MGNKKGNEEEGVLEMKSLRKSTKEDAYTYTHICRTRELLHEEEKSLNALLFPFV